MTRLRTCGIRSEDLFDGQLFDFVDLLGPPLVR
jgi:hypothetical protein